MTSDWFDRGGLCFDTGTISQDNIGLFIIAENIHVNIMIEKIVLIHIA